MAKVLYETRFGKPIEEGKPYVVVLKDGTILNTTARKDNEDPNVVERFLTKNGAEKFVKNMKKALIKPLKTAEEEKLSKMDPLQQLEYVNTKEDYEKWLKRNSLTYKCSSNGNQRLFGIYKSNGNALISFSFSVAGVSYCCGGRENGSHGGEIDSNSSRFLNKAILENLAKQLVDKFENILQSTVKDYGIITYIVDPDRFTNPSSRLGYLFAASKYFQKVARFRNPNTSNILDLYTITDSWAKNL